MDRLFEPLAFTRGPAMQNRFMLAPLTNLQSHADGTLSDEEFHWLAQRARGGFGLVSTCAAHVQAIITLARADGDISIHSLAVNELAKALYGAPVAPAAPAAQGETEPKVAMAVPATALRV